jgi:hypothetical protein
MENFEEMRMRSLQARMRLEVMGIKFPGRPATAVARERYGIKARRKREVLAAFEEMMAQEGL